MDVTDDLAAEAQKRLGYEEGSSNWRAIVERDDIQVIDICTPNDSHAEIAIAAAKAGKHLICEKPLARTGEEAKTMLDAVERARVKHMVAFNYRYTPAVQLAKKLIDEGSIGEILNFRGTYLQDWSADPDSPLSWRFHKKVAGSGTLGDIGTHVIDMARLLVGEIDEVNSVMKTYIQDRPVQRGVLDKLGAAERRASAPREKVDVDDEIMTLVKFQGGAIGSIEATRNAYGRNNFLTFEIHGTKGSVVFNYERRDELQVMFADDLADVRGFRTIYTGPSHPFGQGLWPIPALGIGYGETKIIECYQFFDALNSDKQPTPDFRDGYIINCIADAIDRSSKEQAWTKVMR